MSLATTPRIRSSLSKQTSASPSENEQDNQHQNEIQTETETETDTNANTNTNDNDNALERCVSVTSQTQPERKRKDNMNEKINELLDLIPPAFFADLGEKNTGTKDGKPNKGQILSKTVDYISWLQNEIDVRNRREVELQLILNQNDNSCFEHNKHTVAEEMLAQIGVGPLAEN